MGDIDAMAMQAQMRVNDNRVEDALDYMLDFVEYRPYDEDEYMELVNVLSRLESVTRAWKYRGHAPRELVGEGRLRNWRRSRSRRLHPCSETRRMRTAMLITDGSGRVERENMWYNTHI